MVLVQDPTQTPPLFWKPPGGHGDPGETPEQTAVREVWEETMWEETGLTIDPANLRLVYDEERRNHHYYFFAIEVDDDIERIPSTDPKRHEIVNVVNRRDMRNMPDLLRSARRILIEKALI